MGFVRHLLSRKASPGSGDGSFCEDEAVADAAAWEGTDAGGTLDAAPRADDPDVVEMLARVQNRARRPAPAKIREMSVAPPPLDEASEAVAPPDGFARDLARDGDTPGAGLPDTDPADGSFGFSGTPAAAFPPPRPDAAPRTRLLGFAPPEGFAHDPLAGGTCPVHPAGRASFPVGWLVVIDGPGLGEAFTLSAGVNQIGRGPDQAVSLDFGDLTVSRSNHAALAFDDETGRFYLGHGGKLNLVRLNGRPVLSTEELADRDLIRLGATTLRFVALCGEDFCWPDQPGAHADAGPE